METPEQVEAWIAADTTGFITIACEKFVITKNTARKAPQHDALELTGVLRRIAHQHKVRFIQQNMSDAKKIGGRAILDQLGWRRKGRDTRHMNDAMGQIIMCLAANHPIALEELLTYGIVRTTTNDDKDQR